MLNSIQTRLLLLISIIFIATISTILFVTQENIKSNILKNEEKNIENITNTTFLNIESLYRNLLMDKIIQIQQKKNQLENESRIIESGLKQLIEINGQITKKTKGGIKRWIESAGTSSEIFICDGKNRIIIHKDKSLIGKSLLDIKDFKSRPLFESINRFVVFSWDYKGLKNKKLGYLKRLSNPKWTIGVSVDISRIENESKEKLDFIVQILKNKFPQIKIAKTGTLVLFDSNRNILIPPENKNLELTDDLMKKFIAGSKDKDPEKFNIGEETFFSYTSEIKALNWYISAIVSVDELKRPAILMVEKISIITSIFFVIGLAVMLIAVKKFSNPLKKLAKKLELIPDEDFTSDSFFKEIEKSFSTKRKDEIGILTRSFIFMFKRLQENIHALMNATKEKEKIENELKVARDIQLGILPKIFPPFPEKKEFELHAFLNPAKEVGGDLYDFFLLDEDHLCFTIGDVSGKGVPAALFMAITKTLIKTYSEIEKSPSEIMTKVNSILSKDNPNCMFVTLIIGILNINTGEIKYANAGHNPPIIKKKDQSFYKKGISGPIAGPIEDIEYTELKIKLDHGDMIFLYTDGVTEAMDREKNLYSNERLLRLIREKSLNTAKSYVELVEQDVKDFTRGEMQSDDITILSIIYN